MHPSPEDTFIMCSKLNYFNVCTGNPDFEDVVASKKGSEGQIPIKVTNMDAYVNGTIHHKKCSLMIEPAESRCAVCKVHRGDLSSAHSRLKIKQFNVGSASSNAPNFIEYSAIY